MLKPNGTRDGIIATTLSVVKVVTAPAVGVVTAVPVGIIAAIKMKIKEQIIKLGIIVMIVAVLSTSSEALEYKCETDGWNLNNCGFIIVKF